MGKLRKGVATIASVATALLAAVIAPSTASAVDYTWTSATTGGLWSGTTNWTPTAALATGPSTGDTVTLNSTGSGTYRTVSIDSGASTGVGTLTLTQTNSGTNELSINRNFSVTSAITLSATNGGIARIIITPTSAASLSATFTGGITLNPGGVLTMGAFSGTTTTVRYGNVIGNVTIQGGSLIVDQIAKGSPPGTTTSASNELTGTLTMTSGSFTILNSTTNSTAADRRLTVNGLNITGGAVTALGGSAVLQWYNTGGSGTFAPTTFDNTRIQLSLGAPADQSLTFNRATTFFLRNSGTKTLTSTTLTGTIQTVDISDAVTTAGVGTTFRLGSNLTLASGNAMPRASATGASVDAANRMDLVIDVASFTLDLTANSQPFTPNSPFVVGSTGSTTYWTFSGSNGGRIIANGFNLSGTANAVATSVGPGMILESRSGNSGTNTLSLGSGTGTSIDPTSTFLYSGAADVATPSTLTSNRPIGNVEVQSGALTFSSTFGLQALRVAGGTLNLGTNAFTVTSGSFGGGTVTSGTLTTSGSFLASSGTVSAVLAGTGGLTKSGAGTFTLSGASTYSGATLVNSGSLVVGVADALSASTAVTVAGGVLDLGAFNDTVASFALTSGSLVGSGGKLTAATYALGGGTVGANLGSGTVTVSANTSFGVTSDATAVNLNAGALTLGSAGRFTQPTVAVSGSSGASLALGGDETIGSLAGAANVALGLATLTTGSANTSTTYSGALSGSGSLTKVGAGTFTLSGINGYTGPTTVSGGTLTIGANASIAGSAVTVGGAAALAGSGTAGATTVLSGGILAPGTAGAGTLRLATLAFGTTIGDTATVSIPTTGLGTIPATLSVTGSVSTNGGNGSVTFAFGSLALVPTGTYSLMTFAGSLDSGTSPFTYTGSLSGRQSAALADGGSSLNLVLSSAFPIWSGTAGSGWSTTNNWTLSSDNSPTTFQGEDTVVFNDAGATGTVTISGSNVNPAATTFSGDTLAYTLNATSGFGISTGSLVKSGSATVTIANANTYGGGTTLSAGTLRVGDDAALGSGAVALNGGALSSDSATAHSLANAISVGGNVTLGDATNNGNLTLAGPVDLGGGTRTLTIASPVTLSGALSSGGLTKDGLATLVLTGSNSYIDATTVNAGTLQIGNGGSTGSLAAASAITGSAGATLAFNRSDAITISNGITGGLGVSQIGGGTATLAGSNTYTGPTTVSNGVLSLGSATSLPSQTAVSVAGGGLNLNGATATAGSFAITSGSLFGSGKLTAATYALGGGTVAGNLGSGTLTVTADSSLAGTSDATAVNLNAGALTLGSAGRFTQPTAVVTGSAGASLTLVGNETIGSLAGAANVALGSATLTTGSANTSTTWSGALSGNGGFTKVGSGTWTLSGANTQTGPLALNGGFVQLSSADALGSSGTISFGGGGIIYTSSNTTDYSSRFSTANDQPFNVNMNSQTATWATSLTSAGTASLARSGGGLLTLTGTATSLGTGGITLNGGTTVINPGAAGTFSSTGRFYIGTASGASTVTIQSGSVNLTPATNSYISLADGSGTATLNITGGTTTIGLANTRMFVGNKGTGVVTVSGGFLQITGGNPIYIGGDQSFTNNNANGTLTISGGTVSIPSAGTFSIGNSGSAGNTFTGVSGTLNLNGGELQTARAITTSTLGSSPATSTVNFNGGTLTALAASTTFLQGLTAANVQNGGAIINTNGFDVTIAQNLLGTGTGGVTKTGGGQLTLSGTNTYTGGTLITGAGSLQVSSSVQVGSGTITLRTTGTSTGTVLSLTNGVTLSNPIVLDQTSNNRNNMMASGVGNVTINGPISVTGTGAGQNIITNNVTGGTLTINGNITAASSYTNSLSFRGNTIAISGTFNMPAAGVDLNAGGTTILSSTGNVWLSTVFQSTSNTLRLGANNAMPTSASLSFSGSTTGGGIDLNGFNQTVPGWTNTTGTTPLARIYNDAATDSTLTIAGLPGDRSSAVVVADGTGGGRLALVMNSAGRTQTLTGSNSYTGGTTITAGILAIGAGGTSGALASTGTVSVASGAQLRLFRSDNGVAFGSPLAGSGTVTLVGTGTINQSSYSVNGDNSAFTGTFVVQNGARLNTSNNANATGNAASIVVQNGGQLLANRGVTAPITISGSGWSETAGQLGAIRVNAGAVVSGSVTLAGNSRITAYQTSSGTVSGVISGAASLELQFGTIGLGGANTFSGGALLGVSTGTTTIALRNVAGLGTGTASFVANNTTVRADVAGTVTNAFSIASGVVGAFDTQANTVALSGVISGSGGLSKLGSGRLELTNINTFTGTTSVNAGALLVNGALAGDVVVASGAMLGGSGLYGDQISGAGTVSVGNSPGIGTAASLDPTLGTDFVFEISGTMPNWGSPTNSLNDVLRLTSATPFAANLGGLNEVAVLFSTIEQTTYYGGFYSDQVDFDAAIANGLFTYWVLGSYGDVGNQRQFAVGSGGSLVTYSPLTASNPTFEVYVAAVAQSADFGAGTVNGYSTQFIVVPEPTGLALAGLGVAAAAWGLRRRRRMQPPRA